MADTDEPYLGDLVTIARPYQPVEANLLKSMLEAAGIPATVADANLVQANAWMANAVGGVRVQVPASLVGRAKAAIAEYEQGAFELEGADAAQTEPAPQATTLALWSPDAAAFWSLWLTPIFGTTLHYLNSRTLQFKTGAALAWWLAGIAFTVAALWATLSVHWNVAGVMVASSMSSSFTLVWYVFAGRTQSKHVVSSFGAQYVRRPLLGLWLGTAGALLALGLLGGILP